MPAFEILKRYILQLNVFVFCFIYWADWRCCWLSGVVQVLGAVWQQGDLADRRSHSLAKPTCVTRQLVASTRVTLQPWLFWYTAVCWQNCARGILSSFVQVLYCRFCFLIIRHWPTVAKLKVFFIWWHRTLVGCKAHCNCNNLLIDTQCINYR